MGNCCSDEQFEDIDKPKTTVVPEPEPQPDQQIERVKFVLLGAGDSGKSTLFKQMRINYTSDYSNESLIEHKKQIIRSIYMAFADFVKSVRTIDPTLEGNEKLVEICEDIFPQSPIKALPGTITQPAKELMEHVWTSKAGQEIWENHAKYPITDSLSYFQEDLARFSDIEYSPTEDDLLKARIQTTGIFEQTFQYKGVTISVVDVGGQRNERTKWFQAIDGCTAVLFVASLSGFNQKLYEDATIMRLPEALQVFKKTLNFLPFRLSKVPFVLFLNKEDLFIEKIKRMEEKGEDLDKFFPELGLGTNYDNAIVTIKEHIRDQFIAMCSEQQRRRVIPHYITATDKGIFLQIFQTAAQVVLREALTKHFNPEAED